jgi:hypothetical protein
MRTPDPPQQTARRETRGRTQPDGMKTQPRPARLRRLLCSPRLSRDQGVERSWRPMEHRTRGLRHKRSRVL